MSKKGRLIIIDNHDKRSESLQILCQFINRKASIRQYDNWKKDAIKANDILLVGIENDQSDSLPLLETLSKTCSGNSILTVDGHFSINQLVQYNIAASLHFPFNYTQMIDALHKCEIRNDFITADISENTKAPLFRSLVGLSDSIAHVRELITQVAETDASVMIIGESGTGKEVVARNVHALSYRQDSPFVPINCGAIPSELLESELFGHEKGAFTGAITARQGRFELADKGSLFLDEIGDMPLPMQVKLLRVLQEKRFERVGSNKSIKTNARIITATHRNLELAIKDGKFREDLFYRLNVFPIYMPPLRHRKKDIPLLINELSARLEGIGLEQIHFMPKALEALATYDWPGNVRELANIIERLSILHPQGIIDVKDLPARFKGEKNRHSNEDERDAIIDIIRQHPELKQKGIDLKKYLNNTEMALINQALDDSDWVVAHAADFLNLRRTTLVEKIRRYGLMRDEKKSR